VARRRKPETKDERDARLRVEIVVVTDTGVTTHTVVPAFIFFGRPPAATTEPEWYLAARTDASEQLSLFALRMVQQWRPLTQPVAQPVAQPDDLRRE
jgi:hypothetical protein